MTENNPDSGSQPPAQHAERREQTKSTNGWADRRAFMKASGVLGIAAASQAGIGAVAADENNPSDDSSGDYNVSRTFVDFGSDVHGLLHEPTEESDRSHVAFVFIHPDSDYTTDWKNEISRWGYRSLGMDSSPDKKGGYHLHDLLPELGAGVSYLRDHSKVDQVIIGGHSGGAHFSALYQNVAENGVEIGQDDEKIYPLPDYLRKEEMPPADGLIIIDGHLGYGPKALIDLGAQIANNNPNARIESIDMYNPENGFNPDGASSYSDEFLSRWFAEQADRMEEMRALNQDRQRRINTGQGDYPDDEPFDVVDIKSRVYKTDPRLLSHTQDEWPLLRATGDTVTGEQVPSVRGPKDTDSEPPLRYLGDEVMPMTVKRFLSTHAIRATDDYKITEDSIEGIDYSSTNATTDGNLETVSVPLLVVGATGHYFVVQSEIHMNRAGSSDKTLLYIEGADHGFEPIDPKYGDTQEVMYQTMDRWALQRFCG